MLLERLRERCKSARFRGVAVAYGYTLVFNKKSKDGSGKATIAKNGNDGSGVYGALFKIDLNERKCLTRAEGGDYNRNDKFVVTRIDNNQKLTVTTYVAKQSAIEENLVPYDWYKNLILAGAWQGKFPDTYIARLKAIESIPDPCPQRLGRKEALAVLNESCWDDA